MWIYSTFPSLKVNFWSLQTSSGIQHLSPRLLQTSETVPALTHEPTSVSSEPDNESQHRAVSQFQLPHSPVWCQSPSEHICVCLLTLPLCVSVCVCVCVCVCVLEWEQRTLPCPPKCSWMSHPICSLSPRHKWTLHPLVRWLISAPLSPSSPLHLAFTVCAPTASSAIQSAVTHTHT